MNKEEIEARINELLTIELLKMKKPADAKKLSDELMILLDELNKLKAGKTGSDAKINSILENYEQPELPSYDPSTEDKNAAYYPVVEKMRAGIQGKTALDELLNVFDEACRMEIADVPPEENELLFQADSFFCKGFDFMLTRQIPNEEGEYIQINLTAHYEKDASVEKLEEVCLFSSELDEFDEDENPFPLKEFLKAVKKSAPYRLLKKRNFTSADVTVEET